mmetsp:Transcript_36518/g.53570  ORF Transcript_36518/g.53570 Transcript_36518/m.53570 type:complete len:177 (-) Transcript_36518:13-543(-)
MHQVCTKIFVLAALLSSASGYRMVATRARENHVRPQAYAIARPRIPVCRRFVPCALLGTAPNQGLILTEIERGKDNPAPDEFFYDYPRICYHADASWHAQLTKLYAERLPYGDDVLLLDLMTSWVSHYPTDGRNWGRVTGMGMNADELTKNPQLDFFKLQDLNEKRTLPFESFSWE